MQLVILAAGRATRMYPFSDAIPKSLMPVGGKPVIRRIVDKWSPHVESVVICINDADFDAFNHEFRDESKIDISCSDEPLGTAGEVANAKDYMDDKSFILHYGDIITDIDVNKFIYNHVVAHLTDYYTFADKYVGTLVLIREKLENSIVKVNLDGCVESFDEKPISDNYGWATIAAFSPMIFKYLEDGKDFGKDIFPQIISEGKTLAAYISDSKWYDVGNIRSWKMADRLAREEKL